MQNRQVGWAPSDASGDLAGCVGRPMSIGIDTATAAEIAATPNCTRAILRWRPDIRNVMAGTPPTSGRNVLI